MVQCPNCGGRSIGKIGCNQYYCWECCVEFSRSRNGEWHVYTVLDDGSLSRVITGSCDQAPGSATTAQHLAIP